VPFASLNGSTQVRFGLSHGSVNGLHTGALLSSSGGVGFECGRLGSRRSLLDFGFFGVLKNSDTGFSKALRCEARKNKDENGNFRFQLS